MRYNINMMERIFGGEGVGMLMIVGFGLGWLLAQGTKAMILLIGRRGKVRFSEIMETLAKSGGMPSGHTASMVAMTVVALIRLGVRSEVVAMLMGMSSIVIYDAMNVRWAVGRQGEFLRRLAEDEKELKKALPERIVKGHTAAEVIMGGVLGAAIGVVVGCWG